MLYVDFMVIYRDFIAQFGSGEQPKLSFGDDWSFTTCYISPTFNNPKKVVVYIPDDFLDWVSAKNITCLNIWHCHKPTDDNIFQFAMRIVIFGVHLFLIRTQEDPRIIYQIGLIMFDISHHAVK